MNAQKYTQKSLEAINTAGTLASEYAAAAIEQEHLLYALLTQENGLVLQLIKQLTPSTKP